MRATRIPELILTVLLCLTLKPQKIWLKLLPLFCLTRWLDGISVLQRKDLWVIEGNHFFGFWAAQIADGR